MMKPAAMTTQLEEPWASDAKMKTLNLPDAWVDAFLRCSQQQLRTFGMSSYNNQDTAYAGMLHTSLNSQDLGAWTRF